MEQHSERKAMVEAIVKWAHPDSIAKHPLIACAHIHGLAALLLEAIGDGPQHAALCRAPGQQGRQR